jgi:predicted PurR-regulated permease PerM
VNDARERQVHLYRAILLAAGLVVLGLLFRELVTFGLAVLITVIVAIPLSTFADRLERRGVPRPLGVVAGLLVGLAAFAVVLALVIPSFVSQFEEFVDTAPETLADLEELVHDVTGARTEDVSRTVEDWLRGFVDDPGQLLASVTAVGLGVAGVIGALLLTVITAAFMAARPDPLLDSLLRLIPPGRRADGRRVLARLRESWIGWMRGVALDMVVTGVLVYVALAIIGLDFAILFAVLSALLVVVPYFGAFVGGAFPVLFALTESPGTALAVLIAYLVIQQLESNLTIPFVMARSVNLHPAVIAIGVVLVWQVLGYVGLLVAVPIISAVVILVEELYILPMEEGHAERRRESIEIPGSPLLETPGGGEAPDIALARQVPGRDEV